MQACTTYEHNNEHALCVRVCGLYFVSRRLYRKDCGGGGRASNYTDGDDAVDDNCRFFLSTVYGDLATFAPARLGRSVFGQFMYAVALLVSIPDGFGRGRGYRRDWRRGRRLRAGGGGEARVLAWALAPLGEMAI